MAERIKTGLIKTDVDDGFVCFSFHSKLKTAVKNLIISEKDLDIYILGRDLLKYKKESLLITIVYAKKFMYGYI